MSASPVAATPAPTAPGGGDHVTFRVGHQWLGLPVRTVQEVLVAQRLAPVPLAPRVVAGFLNLRGQIVTAIDLRVLLGGAAPPHAGDGRPDGDTDSHFDVVVRDGDDLFALLVDEVGDVSCFAPTDVGEVPVTLAGPWRSSSVGAVRRSQDVLLVLGLDCLLRTGALPN